MRDDFPAEFINIRLREKETNNNLSIGCGISTVDRYQLNGLFMQCSIVKQETKTNQKKNPKTSHKSGWSIDSC